MSKRKVEDFRPTRDWIEALPADRRERVEAEAAHQIEALRLSEVRRALDVTQTALGERTGLKQTEVSRIENGVESVQLRTLQRYISGLGGTLSLVARFPDGGRAEIPLKAGRPVKSRTVVRRG